MVNETHPMLDESLDENDSNVEIEIDDEITTDEEDFDDDDGGSDEENPTEDSDDEDSDEDDDEITRLKKELEETKRAKDESYKEWQMLNWVSKVYADKYSYLKLYESDKKLAEKVLDHVWEDRTAEVLYMELRKEKFWDNDPQLQKIEIMRELEEKEVKKEFWRMIKSNWIDLKSKEWKLFMEEYNFISDNGKKTTTDNIETLFKKSIKLSGVETIANKKKRLDTELPVWQSRRNSKKAPSKVSILKQFEGKKPEDWY